MTDDSSSSSSSLPSKPESSWNFNQLNTEEDEAESSNDFFSVLKKTVAKHVYLDEPKTDSTTKTCVNERSTTIRVDSSDLISRCKQFLPLLTDANRTLFSKIQSGENVQIELDSDEDEQERRIEMNLMFCPNADSSDENSEQSDDDDDDDGQVKPILFETTKKKNTMNIVEIQSTNLNEDDV